MLFSFLSSFLLHTYLLVINLIICVRKLREEREEGWGRVRMEIKILNLIFSLSFEDRIVYGRAKLYIFIVIIQIVKSLSRYKYFLSFFSFIQIRNYNSEISFGI